MSRTQRSVALVLSVAAVMTMAAFLLKAQCIGAYNDNRDTHFCVNDFQVLYLNRGLVSRTFPYLHGHYAHGQLTGGTIEYPVLTGLFAWLPSLVVSNDGDYLRVTALLLAPFSFLTAWLLHRLSPSRSLLYAAAPPLIWYSFHNWELLVVTATASAVYAWARDRWLWSAALLAVGGALKLWPAFFVLPLALAKLREGDRRGAAAIVGVATAVTIGLNAPFALYNADGWFAPYAFQRDRAADITSNSIWYWGLPQLSTPTLNRLIPALLVVCFLVAASYGWYRSRRSAAGYPFVQVSAAMLCAFMLLNKAHSPQYTLWLLPFFVLLRLRWGWYVGYLVMDALLFFGLFSWYHDLLEGQDFGIAKQATVLGVWGRAAMLALLFVVCLRAETSLAAPEDAIPTPAADPAPALAPGG